MKVTIDSQNWQPIVRPDKFARDPRHANFLKLNQACKDGLLQGCIVDAGATLEGIRRVDRGGYFARPSGHPGLAPVLIDRLTQAHNLGFQLLHAPRIGLEIPAGIDGFYFKEANVADQRTRQERASNAIRDIEGLGVGKDQIEKIGKDIADRLGLMGPWYKFLDRPIDMQENERIADAIGEWADQDAIAAHIAYGNDFFCTDDAGKSASRTFGNSIMTPVNKSRLASQFGVQFLTLVELAAKF